MILAFSGWNSEIFVKYEIYEININSYLEILGSWFFKSMQRRISIILSQVCGFLSIFWHSIELTVLKNHDGFQLFQEGVCLLHLLVGERRSFTNTSRLREKGWVEVGGVYRCVKKFEGVYDWVKRMGWRNYIDF